MTAAAVSGNLLGEKRASDAYYSGIVTALLVSLAGAGFSAHAGLSRPAVAPAAMPATPAGYEADDHFPGAALLYATALVSLKMETPGPFKGTREDVLRYIREFYGEGFLPQPEVQPE